MVALLCVKGTFVLTPGPRRRGTRPIQVWRAGRPRTCRRHGAHRHRAHQTSGGCPRDRRRGRHGRCPRAGRRRRQADRGRARGRRRRECAPRPNDARAASLAARPLGGRARLGRRRWPAEPRTMLVPSDLDFGVFNEAPSDQRCEVLRRREAIVLHGLLAGHPQLEAASGCGRGAAASSRHARGGRHALRHAARRRRPWPRDPVVARTDPQFRAAISAGPGTIVVLAEDVNQRARVEAIEAWVRTPGAAPPRLFSCKKAPRRAHRWRDGARGSRRSSRRRPRRAHHQAPHAACRSGGWPSTSPRTPCPRASRRCPRFPRRSAKRRGPPSRSPR